MTAIQKLLAAVAAGALVFAITLTKERNAQANYAVVRAQQAAQAKPRDIVRGFRDLAGQQGRPDEAVAEYVAPDVATQLPGGTGRDAVRAWLRQNGDQKVTKEIADKNMIVEFYDDGVNGNISVAYRVEGGKIAEISEFRSKKS
ncbi:nuclear transport factor 2 family protein [Sphingobium chungbukense]|uniref:Uncharacterized protein n=1 Tax=Sphingobium chungbukense TaxID=56193 RepID=A0A0M3ATZ3_9SPHN|nr:nuclear transport factor 2 family protein [Sphingobium chungbukense]KKW92014.1 hypothetical protein YP76_13145 [Sphingobium chungbukense]